MLKKVIIRLSVFFALLIILDIAIGSVIRNIYFKQTHGGSYRVTYVLEKGTPDVMILGSSKASHHYIPSIIQDSLKLTCYNGGRDGSFISYANAAVNSILKRYQPKVIILDVLDDEFEARSYNIPDRLSALLPYYRTHPEIRDIVDMKSPFEKYKLLSNLYTFNTLLMPAITGATDFKNKKDAEDKMLGYIPWKESYQGNISLVDSHNEKLDSNKIKGLANIIAACNEKKVKLVVVVSPTYKKFDQNYNPTVALIQQMADSSKTPFWNYLQDTTYLNHKELFLDIRHMNNGGATIFTEDILRRLKALQ